MSYCTKKSENNAWCIYGQYSRDSGDWHYPPRAVSLNRGEFPSRDTCQCLETILIVTIRGHYRVSNGQRPGILLNILQCTGQPLNKKVRICQRQFWEFTLVGSCLECNIFSPRKETHEGCIKESWSKYKGWMGNITIQLHQCHVAKFSGSLGILDA